MQIIKGRKLFENGEFLGENTTVYNFPCERITNSTPRLGWLLYQEGCCGNRAFYQLTLEDPKDSDAIKGVWLEFDGCGVLIDAESVDDVVSKCNGCCGATPEVKAQYDGSFPEEVAVSLQATYEVTRADDGSVRAEQAARLAYMGEYVEGSFSRKSSDGTTSVYTFKAYKDPRPKGADTVTSETVRTFDSQAAAALGAGEQYELTAVIDGVELAPKLTAASIALLAAAAEAHANYTGFGAWSASGQKVRLVATVAVTEAFIHVDIIPV